MNKTQEALKLALEALAASDDFLFNYHDCEPNNEREVDAYSEVRANNMAAWEAVREALAEQQSGIKQVIELYDSPEQPAYRAVKTWHDGKPVYVAEQPAQEPVSWERFMSVEKELQDMTAEFMRVAGELTALKAQLAQQQEPLAYDKTEINCFAQDLYDQKMREGKRGHYESMFHVIHQCIKKFSPPASKPWVKLTDEDIWEVYKQTDSMQYMAFSREIEAKLKEKNNG